MKKQFLLLGTITLTLSSTLLPSITYAEYAENTYTNIATETTLVDTISQAKDVDNDGKLTYLKHNNGYVVNQRTTKDTHIPMPDKEGCFGDRTSIYYTDEFEFNAKSIMDTNLDDYSNNGYLEKVANPINHPNLFPDETTIEKYAGPGNFEIQHWQTGKNEATTQQNWRVVFATDYAIKQAKLTVTLPYSDTTTTDVTDWLINRYYPSVINGDNIYQHKMTPNSIEINGNTATIDLGNIPAGSAYGIIFTKTFDTPQDFSKSLKVTSAKLTGTWQSETLTHHSPYVKSSKTTPIVTWDNTYCPPISSETTQITDETSSKETSSSVASEPIETSTATENTETLTDTKNTT